MQLKNEKNVRNGFSFQQTGQTRFSLCVQSQNTVFQTKIFTHESRNYLVLDKVNLQLAMVLKLVY